ncbi:MAG: hypothetical protein M1834_008676 [Cirrosporium novae-zelandiae]|nr:MAG: hypothetical protein M1834_008676 [Cirrosporium novae-zelandiae]
MNGSQMEASELGSRSGGFDGFTRRLPDDCIEYTLFVLNSKLEEVDTRNRLREIQRASTELTKKQLKDYIWQRDNFNLELVREDGRSFIRGRTNYGDCIEDEWLIVYLLRELTKQFTDLWVKAVDTDGEFLLIEAANALPRWLNPEIADNRVWLHSGNLYIIPPEFHGSNSSARPRAANMTLKEALKYISQKESSLTHSQAIEDEALYRLRNYPGQIKNNSHHALVTVPRNLAYILAEDPSYISPAVGAFYLRDPIALSPLKSENSTDMIFPPVDLVTVSIKFNRVGYAQIKSQQQFTAPPIWNKIASTTPSGKEMDRTITGMKVTSGFEMLVSDPHNQDKKPVREIKMLLEDLSSGDAQLPTNSEISKWQKIEDDESWLDINFEDFERELSGKNKGKQSAAAASFGDKTTQENLRKIVSRFEDFLNDNAAGAEGAEFLDDMDYDTDEEAEESDDDGNTSDGEDKEVSFDEEEFARMMREMMGLPSEDSSAQEQNLHKNDSEEIARVQEVDSDDDIDEAEAIQDVMRKMEAELNEAGALDLDPTPRKIEATKPKALKGKGKALVVSERNLDEDEDESDEGEIDVDYNLAKNLLESFKSQAGTAGPGGNLIRMLGLRLPRDEQDDDDGPFK